MTELTKDQLAEGSRLRKGTGGRITITKRYRFDGLRFVDGAHIVDLLDAAESRLAMLGALSAYRAEEIADRIQNADGWDDYSDTPLLSAYALAAREEKGAGE